ncbi:MAG: twin-arginine translocase TatA/TatE family subunit [Planctomycetaceae bacterium]
MLNVGPQELLIILLIALIVVGPQKLPELSRQIGKGLREFKRVQDEVKDMVKFDLLSEPEPPRPAPSAGGRAAPGPGAVAPSSPGVHRTPRPAPIAAVEEVAAPRTGDQGGASGVPDIAADEPPAPAQ